MGRACRLFSVFAALASPALSGCYEIYQKPQDMENVRRQFHLPDAATFISFDSNPKSFLPEGLRIEATVQFSDTMFDDYVALLNDAGIWKPVSYISYSPDIGEEYSAKALRWSELPLPHETAQRGRKWQLIPDGTGDISNGQFYCSVIRTVRGQRLPQNPNAYHWKPVGLACNELDATQWPTIGAMGVLDFGRKTLHAVIGFSG